MSRFLFLRWALAVLAGAFFALPARAQTLPPADWAVACGSNGGPVTLAVDAFGNTYVAGYFRGTITIGPATLTATQTPPGHTGPRDVFIAKLNAQGQYQWATQLGDGQSVQASQIAADNFGNVYLTGSFDSYSMQVGAGGPTLYNSSNNDEGFVARLSGQNGQCQWARRFGGTGADGGNIVAVNATGEVYLVGTTGDAPADLGPYTLPAAPSYTSRGFLAKLSASGSWLWVQQPNMGIASLLFDGLGNFYTVGTFKSPGVTIGSTTLSIGALSGGSPGYDAVVAKYTEGGVLRWARQANPGGHHSLSIYQAAYDGQGHLYLVGSFGSQTAQIGSFVLTNAGPLYPPPIGPAPPNPNTDRYFTDAFVARLDTAGTWQWAVRRGSASTDDYADAATLDAVGNLWISCQLYQSGISTCQLSSLGTLTGAWRTDYTLPASFSLINDQLSRLYIGSTFTTTSLSLGGQTVPGVGNNRSTGYVARLGAGALATRPPAAARPGLQAWPSPGLGTGVWVQGAPAGQTVEVFDVLGRRVGGGPLPASGTLRLSWGGAGLAPGVYIVHSGALSCRWVVE